MVSVHPNPQPGHGFTGFYNSHFAGDPMSAPAMKTTENNSFPQTASYWSSSAGVEDPSKKFRKPYTITKSRESWTEMEHEKFIEALHLFDRDWKKIEAFVGSKTVIQIRSHAQKHFMKVQKNGMKEHVPLPRPKRKAAHPYPHKAPKNGLSSSAALLNSNYDVGPQSVSAPGNLISTAPSYPWICTVPSGCDSPLSKDDFALSGGATTHNWSSNSNDVAPPIWASSETNSQVKEKLIGKRALPDFAQVYSFIGSMFDPSARDHLEELKKMDPIDIETVLMLMDNLALNLVNPEFENHRKLLSSYNVDIQNDHTDSETSSKAQ
ncbi:Homeodomain-like superfamily protein [Perilla frutescens var. hirtella]|uniref:Homeodomain-like superfamily protein n=1 Tax=Perilla frutescens var. hirtella TaxID=608512 RepID=A0AAD4JA34_PERFH|nr:Homeodomain-like superfamily protein [Perilla frutescens var. hirtella]